MKNKIHKRGQKIIKKFSKASVKASEDGKEHIKENLIGRVSHITSIKLLIAEWSLLVGALILLAIAQAFWFGESYAENTFSDGGTYTEATLGDVKSMNPLFATTSSEKVLSKLLFATLSTIDYSGHANIGLAESIKPNEDCSIWTVKLREGLKWSDGEPITNEDVIFTAELINNPAVNSIYSSNLSRVKISESEKGEIVFSLPSSYVDFISTLNFPILPKHILKEADPRTLIENDFSNAPVSSGAFAYNAVQATNNDEKVFYLSANPNYYEGRTMLDSFAIHTYSSKDSIINALNSGSVTATAEISESDSEKVSSNQFNIHNSSLNAGAFIFFNTNHKALKSVDTRQAIRQGLDLTKIRELAKNTTAIDYPLIDSQIKLSSYPNIPTYDFEKAKATLNKIDNEDLKHLEIATVNIGFLPGVANEIKSELENLGFETNLVVYDENQDFINTVIAKRNYDVLVYEIDLGSDPDLLPYLHSSQAADSGFNLANYRNAIVDDLLLSTRDVVDNDLRIKKYEALLEYWVNDAPMIGLYQPNLSYYYNKNIRSFSDNIKLTSAIDRFTDVNSWATVKSTKNKTP